MAIAMLSCGILLSACTGSAPPELQRYRPGSGGAIEIGETSPHKHYAFDDITMCVEGEGSVRIVAAAAIEPTGGLTVSSFAVLPSREGDTASYVSDASQTLADAGYPTSGGAIVNTHCPPAGEAGDYRNYTRLGIEVSRTDPEEGTTRGVRVTYESNGGTLTIDYPLALALCRSALADAPDCTVTPIRID